VKVVLLSAFSGADPAAGRKAEAGVRLQTDAVNAGGGLLGRRLEVVTADDEGDPGKARELVREELLDPGVGLVVGPSSAAAFDAAKGVMEASSVPSCVSGASDTAMADAPLSFRVAPSRRALVTALLSHLQRNDRDVKALGALSTNDQAAAEASRLLKELAGGFGLQYVGLVSASGGAGGASAAQQLLDRGAGAALLLGGPEATARVVSDMQAAGLQGRLRLLGLDGVADYRFPAAAGDAAAGSVFASEPAYRLTDLPEARWPAAYRDFVRRAGAAYGYGTAGVDLQASPEAADCLLQWSAAVRRSGTFGGAAVAAAWKQLQLPADVTALGVREGPAGDHTMVRPESVAVYSWTKSGASYRLKQLEAPASP
jgi:branched-chain amino acid transport system substrate-binding protein